MPDGRKNGEGIFDTFPKLRPELPPEYQEIYEEQIKRNRAGEAGVVRLSSRMERWMHREVAKFVVSAPGQVLEIGAGTLNHVPYEETAIRYDIVEPFTALYESSPHLERVDNRYADISQIPPRAKYQKILSIAVLEHICDLPKLLRQAIQHLSPGGELLAAVPSEGTLLWKLGWKLTTGIEFRLRHGLDYGVVMRHEHVNTGSEIESVLRALFTDVEASCLGLSSELSLYRCFRCRGPKAKR